MEKLRLVIDVPEDTIDKELRGMISRLIRDEMKGTVSAFIESAVRQEAKKVAQSLLDTSSYSLRSKAHKIVSEEVNGCFGMIIHESAEEFVSSVSDRLISSLVTNLTQSSRFTSMLSEKIDDIIREMFIKRLSQGIDMGG